LYAALAWGNGNSDSVWSIDLEVWMPSLRWWPFPSIDWSDELTDDDWRRRR